MMKIFRKQCVGVIAMLALLVPAYSQEINPTWYDPWAAEPNKAVVQNTQPRPAKHKKRKAIGSAAPQDAKARGQQEPKRLAITNEAGRLPLSR